MTASKNVPAASGLVKIQKDKDNGNTKLDIKVEHLANPSTLSPPANAYIVWIRPNGSVDAIKQGAIRMDKNLNAELKVVTVAKDFDLFVTAEQSESTEQPSDFTVLETHVSLQ
ncbi:MAG TPA: hypothetical protein VMV57_04775 [Terracidiphilus sp.]|nr:hypothetical protein [Terracidiphilus sp.]